ncbi:MAG: V-type ATP synthase subunit F [Nanoarchaeota archaeon]
MKDIVIVGEEKFVMGFQIAGLTKTFSLNEDHPDNTIKELISNQGVGLIIIDQESVDKLGPLTQETVMNSVEPVFLVISENDSQGELRNMIKKSIGVDLWNK